VKTDRYRYVSTILFVDGHSAKHEFTKVIKDNPEYPYEPTKDWIWYKEAEKMSVTGFMPQQFSF